MSAKVRFSSQVWSRQIKVWQCSHWVNPCVDVRCSLCFHTCCCSSNCTAGGVPVQRRLSSASPSTFFVLSLLISFISSVCCSVTWRSPLRLSEQDCLKSHIWKAVRPLFSCEWTHSMAGGLANWTWRGWWGLEAALSGSTWAERSGAGALIYHVGWWYAARGLEALCISIRLMIWKLFLWRDWWWW